VRFDILRRRNARPKLVIMVLVPGNVGQPDLQPISNFTVADLTTLRSLGKQPWFC
jgi:hypothetical protein